MQRTVSELLQQLWGSLHPSKVVAPDSIPWSLCKQATQGQTATEDNAWQGRDAQPAALRNGRIFEGDYSDSLGDEYSYQNGVFPHSPTNAARRDCDDGGGKGQINGSGSCGIPQANPCGKGSTRCRDPGEDSGYREVCSGPTAGSYHPQNSEPAPKGRKDPGDHQGPDLGPGRKVEDLLRGDEDQVCRTRRTLQGQEEAACREESGDKRQDSSPATGNSEGCSQTGASRSQGRVHERARFGFYDGRPDLRQRRGEQREASVDGWGDRSIATQEGQHRCGEKLISFAPQTQVSLYYEEAPDFAMNFSVPLLGLRAWENKPWALYGGAYVDSIARSVLHAACGHLAYGHRRLGEQEELSHDVRGCDGDQAQGVSGQVQLPLLLHPGPMLGKAQVGSGTEATIPNQRQDDIGADDCDQGSSTSCSHFGAAVSSSEPDAKTPLDVYMFGLLGGYLGRRDRRLHLPRAASDSDRQQALRELIQRTWNDFDTPETQFYIPVPQPDPEPQCDGSCIYVVVNFLARHVAEHSGLVPVLFDAKGWTVDTQVARRTIEAAMVPERAHWSMLSASCGLQNACLSRQGNQCLIRIGSFLCIDDNPHVVPDGSLLTFNYDIDEMTQATPRLSLLQINAKLVTRPQYCKAIFRAHRLMDVPKHLMSNGVTLRMNLWRRMTWHQTPMWVALMNLQL